MKTDDPRVQVYVKIKISEYNSLRSLVDELSTTMTQFIRDAIREKMEKSRGKTNRIQ